MFIYHDKEGNDYKNQQRGKKNFFHGFWIEIGQMGLVLITKVEKSGMQDGGYPIFRFRQSKSDFAFFFL